MPCCIELQWTTNNDTRCTFYSLWIDYKMKLHSILIHFHKRILNIWTVSKKKREQLSSEFERFSNMYAFMTTQDLCGILRMLCCGNSSHSLVRSVRALGWSVVQQDIHEFAPHVLDGIHIRTYCRPFHYLNMKPSQDISGDACFVHPSIIMYEKELRTCAYIATNAWSVRICLI